MQEPFSGFELQFDSWRVQLSSVRKQKPASASDSQPILWQLSTSFIIDFNIILCARILCFNVSWKLLFNWSLINMLVNKRDFLFFCFFRFHCSNFEFRYFVVLLTRCCFGLLIPLFKFTGGTAVRSCFRTTAWFFRDTGHVLCQLGSVPTEELFL